MDRKGDWIETYTGKQFWPLDPRPEDVCIEDIARGLAMSCRYGGQVNKFYSVAEHAWLVSLCVPPQYALVGLLHDASEAYISDIVRPVKRYIQGYATIEENLMQCISERFGFEWPMPSIVKEIDNRMIVNERAAVKGDTGFYWGEFGTALPITIYGLEHDEAEYTFIDRFYKIMEDM